MPYGGPTLQQPPGFEAPTGNVFRRVLGAFGRRLNYLGILGGVVAFVSLVMPWWTVTASVPATGLGTTAMDFPLYLYNGSAGFLANPPQVISLDPWFCWLTLALVALAGILAVVGSVRPGKGKRILILGGVTALLSLVVFGVALQYELSTMGSGVDLFSSVVAAWGTLSAYLSFGFWGGLIAAATILFAAKKSTAMATVPPVTAQPFPSEAVPTEPYVGRPRGIKLMIACCSILGILAIASASFTSSLAEAIRQLPIWVGGIGVPDLTYLWAPLVCSAAVDFVITYGLLKRKRLMHAIVRVLSVLAVVGTLIVIVLVAVLVWSPDLLGVGPSVPLTSGNVTVLYGGLTIMILLGIIVPVLIFWYVARPHVKEYFGLEDYDEELPTEYE